MNEMQINAALEKFKTLLIEQDERNQKIKATKEFKDFKNLDKIEMLEGESEGGYSEARSGMRSRSYMGGSSYDDDMMYSERRGRGRNARRASMGRYSSDEGSSYDNYSEDGNSYRGSQSSRGYSRDDAKDHMMSKLGAMMEDADPNEREILKDAMRKLERA